jgi:hypothetical protein
MTFFHEVILSKIPSPTEVEEKGSARHQTNFTRINKQRGKPELSALLKGDRCRSEKEVNYFFFFFVVFFLAVFFLAVFLTTFFFAFFLAAIGGLPKRNVI